MSRSPGVVPLAYAALSQEDLKWLAQAVRERALPQMSETEEVVARLESRLATLHSAAGCAAFGSGRVALEAIMKALGLGAGDEVIVPGFTCAVVPFAIQRVGARPVYVDIDETYRYDQGLLARAVGPKTRAILLQHTFGIPERVSECAELAGGRPIALIADSAHRVQPIPGPAQPAVSFLSFEMTKPLTAGTGGAALAHDEGLLQGVRRLRDSYPTPASAQDRLMAGRTYASARLHRPTVTPARRALLSLLLRSRLLPLSISRSERRGGKPRAELHRMSWIQAELLHRQLDRLPEIEARRRTLTGKLERLLGRAPSGQALLRLPVLVEDPQQVRTAFADHGFEVGRWFESPTHPADVSPGLVHYARGSCPRAEAVCGRIVNLPTLLSAEHEERFLQAVERVLRPAVGGAIG